MNEENNIKYLGYGADLQVAELQLMEYLSDTVNNYVNDRPWTNKRKKYFMEAYLDMLNRGLVRAIPDNGVWSIEINGNDLDLSNMSEKKADMYHLVAYFIRNSMKRLAEDSKKEQEEKKNNAILFTNDLFLNDFNKHISFSILGGQPFTIGEENDKWNYRDKIDPLKGERNTENRKRLLSLLLKSYSDSLNDNSYNFENSPFKNLSDFKSKINDAINALNTEDLSDDTEALNAIGLRYSDWFNNGSGEFSGRYDQNGKPLTNKDYFSIVNLFSNGIANSISSALFPKEKSKEEDENELLKLKHLDEAKAFNEKINGESFKLTDRLDNSDIPLAISAAGDIASLFGGWANVGGTIASIVGDTAYDMMKGQVGWDTFLNIGTNAALGVVGLIPGFKASVKGGKAFAKTAMICGKISNIIRAGNLMFANREGVLSLLDKLASGKITELSSDDAANARDLLGLITGSIRVRQASNRIKAHDRYVAKLKFKVNNNEEVSLSNEQVQEINRIGNTRGRDAAKKLFKDYTGKDMPDNLSNQFTEVKNYSNILRKVAYYPSRVVRAYNPINNTNTLRTLKGKNKLKGESFLDEAGILRLTTIGYRNLGDNNNNRLMDYFVYPTGGKRTARFNYGINSSVVSQNNPVTEKPVTNPVTPKKTVEKPVIEEPVIATLNSVTPLKFIGYPRGTKKLERANSKKLLNNLNKGKGFTNEIPKDNTIWFEDSKGNVHTWKLITRKNDFLLEGKSSDGSLFSQSLNLNNVKSGIHERLMLTFNEKGHRSNILLPLNVIKILQGTSYGWLKQGGKINKYTIKNFLK